MQITLLLFNFRCKAWFGIKFHLFCVIYLITFWSAASFLSTLFPFLPLHPRFRLSILFFFHLFVFFFGLISSHSGNVATSSVNIILGKSLFQWVHWLFLWFHPVQSITAMDFLVLHLSLLKKFFVVGS